MSILIDWVNPNTSFDSVRLYRTTVPLDYGNIPASPLITMSTGTTYLDTTALAETYYYYTTAVVKDGEVILSPSTLVYQLVNSGPGPQTLQCGDWLHGYFGTLTNDELFSGAEMCAKLTTNPTPTGRSFVWCKFIVNGKILFAPADWLALTPWNVVYQSGMAFGINGPGPTPSDLTAVNQYTVMSKGDDEFIVRLPRLQDEGNFNWVYSATISSDLLRLFISQGQKGISQPQVNVLGDAMSGWNTSGSFGTVCMEYNGLSCGTISSTGIPNTTAVARTANSNWRPILELVK